MWLISFTLSILGIIAGVIMTTGGNNFWIAPMVVGILGIGVSLWVRKERRWID